MTRVLSEIDSCKGYLRQQIELIRPQVVMTLGNFATKLLLRTEVGITRMRGQNIPVVARRNTRPHVSSGGSASRGRTGEESDDRGLRAGS